MQPLPEDELDDISLMRDFQSGDKEAMAQLLRRRQAWLYTIARRTISDVNLAQEGLQEGLTQIWRGASSFRGEAQVSSWMYRVMVRACIDVLRKEKIRTFGALPEGIEEHSADPLMFEDRVVDRLLVHGALAELEPLHQEILKMLYIDDFSPEEISMRLLIPLGTVKSRTSRAQRRLREVLRELLDETGNFSGTRYVKESEVKHVPES